MKKLILTLTILLTSFTASAWQYNMGATWTPQRAQVQVVNNYGRTIVCNGNLVGQFANGMTANAWMSNQYIPAGQFRYLFVNAQNAYMNPVVYAQANINCEFANPGGGFNF